MSVLNTNELLFEQMDLFVPELKEIETILSNDLLKNFEEVIVDIVDCPNLQNEPFHLAREGLCGSTRIIDLGGPPFLLPLVDRTKIYDLKEVCRKVAPSNSDIFAIGAGAGPHPLVNTNCEGIINLSVLKNGETKNSQSHLVKVEQESGQENYVLEKISSDDTRCALMSNLFLSEGKSGKVLHVYCKKRIGKENFIHCIRNSLFNHFKDQAVGLGGVFLLKNGKAKQHVMRDFSKTPINTEEELNNWLKFYEMSATLIAVGTLVSKEVGLDLRLEHFHSFSKHGDGGHYHYDTTPDIVEYEGYFNVGEKIIRVDKPIITHQIGRD